MDIEQRAKRSKSLLENEWFQETMKDLRNQQTKIFVNSAAHELEQREEAHAILRALKSIGIIAVRRECGETHREKRIAPLWIRLSLVDHWTQ